MRKLTTDIFYYYRLFVALVIPFMLCLTSIEISKGQNAAIFIMAPVIFLVIVLFQWIWLVKYRQIFYDENGLLIKSYFSQKSISIPLENLISVVKKSDFYGLNLIVNYKLHFTENGNISVIYFYRATELSKVSNLEEYFKARIFEHIQIPGTAINEKNDVTVKKRLLSAMLDHFIMTIVCMIFSIPLIIGQFSESFDAHQSEIDFHITPLTYISFLGFALYFCKDCFYGQSFAKREFKLQVVKHRTGEIANPIRCFVRNIPVILWPIEVVWLLVNPGRRFGDLIAGTKVIPHDPEIKRPQLNYLELPLSVLFSYLLLLLIVYLTGGFAFFK